mmetsp:Transcript_62120/g.69551  ORF Transcript_62120/g.69551 Transcript_62120/m.69551 type:complete len:89 (-) Transcript_62120:769-1035(-)
MRYIDVDESSFIVHTVVFVIVVDFVVFGVGVGLNNAIKEDDVMDDEDKEGEDDEFRRKQLFNDNASFDDCDTEDRFQISISIRIRIVQ